MSNYSIYIPRVFNNISNQKIINAFEQYDIGTISSIDVNRKTGLDGTCYKVVFVHFSHWNEHNSAAINLRERIENPEKEARLVYDDPWYWILLPNTSAWKQDNMYQQPQQQPWLSSVQSCYDRISNVENELTKIYKELYKKSYIPVNYSDCMESNDIESCTPTSLSPRNMSPMTIDELMVDLEQWNIHKPNMSPMTIDELMVGQDDGELHKPPSPPLNQYLSKISCEHDYDSDFELDLESGVGSGSGSGCSIVDYESGTSIESKRWMTAHFCGNE